MIGCRRSNSGTGATCSRAVFEPDGTSLPGNTLASSMPGSRVRGSTVRPTVPTRCAGRRRRRSTERLVTFARFSFCSDIRSSKAPSGISGSRWMTLSASQSRLNSDGFLRPRLLAGPQPPGRLCPKLPHSCPCPPSSTLSRSDFAKRGSARRSKKGPRLVVLRLLRLWPLLLLTPDRRARAAD